MIIKKLYYYCTCSGGKAKDLDRESRGFREVKIDADGVCKDCGYYAVALTRKVKNRTQMYSILRLDKEEEENYYIGSDTLVGSVLDNIKYDIPKKKVRHKNRKLTDEKEREIKLLLNKKCYSHKKISEMTGEKVHTISCVNNGKYVNI